MEQPHIIRADAFMELLAPALGIDLARVRRIVIDCTAREPVRFYVEHFGDERLLGVILPSIPPEQLTTAKADHDHPQ